MQLIFNFFVLYFFPQSHCVLMPFITIVLRASICYTQKEYFLCYARRGQRCRREGDARAHTHAYSERSISNPDRLNLLIAWSRLIALQAIAVFGAKPRSTEMNSHAHRWNSYDLYSRLNEITHTVGCKIRCQTIIKIHIIVSPRVMISSNRSYDRYFIGCIRCCSRR